MKIKLDENISRHLKLVIIQKGHECVTAEDEGLLPMWRSELLRKAKAGCFLRSILNVQTSISFRPEVIPE
jgi:hypothetical protein